MKKINFLKKLYKIFNALLKLIPTLIDVIQDFSDDGKINKSNRTKVESKTESDDKR